MKHIIELKNKDELTILVYCQGEVIPGQISLTQDLDVISFACHYDERLKYFDELDNVFNRLKNHYKASDIRYVIDSNYNDVKKLTITIKIR